ncbi:hypothetical protein LCGC14_0018350 [marine sediment metagenome]|uniref:Uncharacterized protein n=1 Tax=marine sediment metagenome TaxID=412755 RepID=A0A0F9Z2M4_9ZZZZ
MSRFIEYRQGVFDQCRTVYDQGADTRQKGLKEHRYYYRQIRHLLNFVVEEGARVLCIGSDLGQYLEWVNPSRGVGVEISPRLVERSARKYPDFEFHEAVPEQFHTEETFDYILIINTVNDLFDVQQVLENVRPACSANTRVVIAWYSFLWRPLLGLGEKLRLKQKQPPQNWLSFDHLAALLTLAGYERVRRYRAVLCPIFVPIVSWLMNFILARMPFLSRLCMVNVVVAQLSPEAAVAPELPSVSVIIPCKNEQGNIEEAVLRMPTMGSHTELIFCDDKSTDGTADEVRRMQELHPDKDIKLVDGPGICKAQNVWVGFDAAQSDIVMILDADLTVPPEELPKFYQALASGKGGFINGTRMVYPKRDDAMRMANVFGNKLFSIAFSKILRERITDTLCGTKALWRKDYQRLRKLRGSWGINDRWGDYELIFGAAKLNLKHIDLPVHYMERAFGETKMTGRLRNAFIMLRMCLAAFLKLR